jgi:Rrf2 family protein
MFKKETEYALRALVYIQRCNLDKRRPGIAEIGKETEAPQPFIAKILNKLVRQNVLVSFKGKGGGFYFDPSKPDLPLNNLITMLEGDKIFTGCGFGLKQCDENNPCPLHEHYSAIRNEINSLVTTATIQSLAGKNKQIYLSENVKQ